MKQPNSFILALIIAGVVESILVIAAATFAFPYFGAGDGQHDSEFVTFCRMTVAFLHLPTIILARSFLEGSRMILPFIVVVNVGFLTVLFWPLILLARKICERRKAA
jgi:hypothetical protein